MTSDSKEKKGIADYIKQLGAYAICLTFLAIGVALANMNWSATVTDLNSQLGNAHQELRAAQDELTQVKVDYFSYKTMAESKGIAVNSNTISVVRPDTFSTKESKTETKRVNTEKSVSFFNGDLTISLIATPFEGDPLHHRVLANISSPSGETVKINKEDIGSVITYKNKRTFKITILESETFSATFKVTEE